LINVVGNWKRENGKWWQWLPLRWFRAVIQQGTDDDRDKPEERDRGKIHSEK
jgi:hypothetical protein